MSKIIRKRKIEKIKEKLKEREKYKKTRIRLIEPLPKPRYDEIFVKGTEWLNNL